MKSKRTLTLALAILCLMSCIKQDMTLSSDNATSARAATVSNVKVATYNLHLFLFPAYFEDTKRQIKIQEFIKKGLEKNDVLFLTEIWKDVTKNEIIESVKSIYPYSFHTNVVNASMGDGMLILSKFPIKKSQFFTYKNSAGLDKLVPKGFHKILFETSNGDFYAFFTHAQADADKSITRQRQFEEIKSQMIDLNGTPSIIVGDLNVVGDTDGEYKSLLQIFNQYKDGFRKSNADFNSTPGYTYSNVLNALAEYFFPKGKNKNSNERLDYILYSYDGWNVVSSRVVTECDYYSTALSKTAPCSDHYGLETGLVLTKKVVNSNPNIASTRAEAEQKINSLKASYGTGLTARTIIYNNTPKSIYFKNKTAWYNSSFYNAPASEIPSGKYAVVLATHDTGEATGVFNQMSYSYENTTISFGTYVPWSWVYTNNILVDFNEITYGSLNKHSRPTKTMMNAGLKITGKIYKGDSPLVVFTVERP